MSQAYSLNLGQAFLLLQNTQMKQIFLLLLCALPGSLWAQQKGNFDKAIEFMGSTRLVSVYVPEDYDPQKQYPMYMGLHGFNQSTYAIRAALQPIAEARGAIVVCPSGNGDRHDDEFPANENGFTITQEIGLVHTTLDSAQHWFSVDPAAVILTGFSYGGREALYFGLHNYFKFQGIIGLSPAIQSIGDVNNNLAIPRPNPFAYTQQSKIPICLCAGDQDDYFIDFIKAMHTKLAENEGPDTLILNPAGHTLSYPEFNADFNACVDFIDRNKVATSTSLPTKVGTEYQPRIRMVRKGLRLESKTAERFELRITNLNGQMVYNNSFTEVVEVSTASLPEGNYIIQVLSNTSCESFILYLP